ncbi:MAG TPA: metallophosphoesterase, partial [Syntrophomonadaceae bacterium]|nr:metallophosphoesterase [Syntrophomonadaceae bacterium]
MQKVISILHISDLHRSQAFPISNTVLINSLEKDLERYVTNEDIPKPSLIIVSGDIVNGKGTMDEIY